jgi:hypothetical protein
MASSDHEINRGVRSVLSRHWVDLTKTAFASRRGIVRLMGEMRRVGTDAQKPLDPTNLEVIDNELRRVTGVTRVHFDLSNWHKNSEGEWELSEEARRRLRSNGPGEDGDGPMEIAPDRVE